MLSTSSTAPRGRAAAVCSVPPGGEAPAHARVPPGQEYPPGGGALDDREGELARASRPRWIAWCGGRRRSRKGRGRSSRPAGSANSSRNSSSMPASTSLMCRRRWRLGCVCSTRARRGGTTPTTPARWPSPQCAHRTGDGSGPRTQPGCGRRIADADTASKTSLTGGVRCGAGDHREVQRLHR